MKILESRKIEEVFRQAKKEVITVLTAKTQPEFMRIEENIDRPVPHGNKGRLKYSHGH